MKPKNDPKSEILNADDCAALTSPPPEPPLGGHKPQVIRAVWRFDVTPMTKVSIPKGARFLGVRMGSGAPVIKSLWEVNTLAEPEDRYLTLLTTGEPIPEGAQYLGLEIMTGALVYEIPADFANL